MAAPDIHALEAGVVRVAAEREGGMTTGTGFVLNDAGHIATNHHVVADAASLFVLSSGSVAVHEVGAVVWSSAALDLAVIAIDGLALVPVGLAEKLPNKGASVYALGFPGEADTHSPLGIALDVTVTSGVLSRVFRGAWAAQELTILQHDADINPGSSGGPLLDECGRVIGTNTRGTGATVTTTDGSQRFVPAASGVFWASAIQELRAELDRLDIPYRLERTPCVPVALVPPVATPSASAEPSVPGTTNWLPFLIALVGVAVVLALFIHLVRRDGQGLSMLLARLDAMHKRRGVAPRLHSHASQQHALVLIGTAKDGTQVRVEPISANAASASHGVVLGRYPALVDRVINNREISRRHVRVRWTGREFQVEDLNSRNGTSVNGATARPYQPVRLGPGDALRCGNVQLRASISRPQET